MTRWRRILLLVLVVCLWRFGLHVVSSFADVFFLYAPSFPYAKELLAVSGLPKSVYSFANFDGVHYITIATKGYIGTGLIQAFFPVFPLLLMFFGFSKTALIVGGLILSLAFFIGFIFFLYQLVQLDSPTIVLNRLLVVVLLFPTSFFFASLYAESLFLLLVVLSFFMARKKQWLLAVSFAALASATKVVGVALVPALMVEAILQAKKKNLRHTLPLLAFISLGALGLFVYMYYLHKNFDDPLYFLHVQSEFGAGRQESLVLLPQVLYRYLKIALTYRPMDWKYFAYIQELVFFISTAVVLFCGRKKIRLSYLLFSTIALITPTVTGNLSSIPRYALACFPLFIVLSQETRKHTKLFVLWLIISGILLVINTLLFLQGYWVA